MYERKLPNLDVLMNAPFAEAVESERAFQRQVWGDNHDDCHSGLEWGAIILDRAGRVGRLLVEDFGVLSLLLLVEFYPDRDLETIRLRTELIKLAAVCAAMVERLDRIATGGEDDRPTHADDGSAGR